MSDSNNHQFICGSSTLRAVASMARRVAPSKTTVLITGETGVGKEVFARLIHKLSGRKGNFVAINCCAISRDLFESEMFGSLRGSFTSSVQSKPGLIEGAEHGTLYLDEIGDMPLENQTKLLRFLENKEFRPVGGIKVNFSCARIVASTNADLSKQIEAGKFRQDLMYRLNHFNLRIPPLRERMEEIPELVRAFADEAVLELTDKQVQWPIDQEFLDFTRKHSWPGNIRELRHLVFRMALMSDRNRFGMVEMKASEFQCDMHMVLAKNDTEFGHLSGRHQAERDLLAKAFADYHGNITKMSAHLGFTRSTLYTKLNFYGIRRVNKRPNGHDVTLKTREITRSTEPEISGTVEAV